MRRHKNGGPKTLFKQDIAAFSMSNCNLLPFYRQIIKLKFSPF